MKQLENITGAEVLDKYSVMQGEYFLVSEYKHLSKSFDRWLFGIRNGSEEYSLNKENYLGKKTRALISVLGIKEPKTKKELTKILANL